MNLAKLYEAQAKLDADIVEKKHLQGVNLLPNKILALNVELGELAQEVQGEWKHWKEHTTRDDKRVLNEFVDCLHFALSIGLEAPDVDTDSVEIDVASDLEYSTTEILCDLFGRLTVYIDQDDYEDFMCGIIFLGHRVGFTDEQIEAAYFHKNAINHERQVNDY